MEKIYVDFTVAGQRDDSIQIELSDSTVEELFDDAFDGFCPVCHCTEINVNQTVCCECLAQAIRYHKGIGCCVDQTEET